MLQIFNKYINIKSIYYICNINILQIAHTQYE